MAKLLEKAKARKLRTDTPFKEGELIELALAWLTGEVSYTQVCDATNKRGSAAYGLLATSMRRALHKGLISIKK